MRRNCVAAILCGLVVCFTGLPRVSSDEAKNAEDEYYELMKVFVDTFQQIDRNYVKDIDRKQLVEAAVKGMLDKLDPYSDYISPDDLSKFTEAVAHKVYYGPVYFRRDSEPYMTLALAGARKDAGVSIAEVNLKLIWDVVSQIKVGERGHAYVVGPEGRLIAHPDISLVLRNTDMSRLPQVRAARNTPDDPNDDLQVAQNVQGREVLTASAPIEPLGWRMFVELPVEEAYASLYEALYRLAYVLLAAMVFAVLAGVFLARRMVVPIQAFSGGRPRILATST